MNLKSLVLAGVTAVAVALAACGAENGGSAADRGSVEAFLADYTAWTWRVGAWRVDKLDQIIRQHEAAGLGPDGKAAALEVLSPPRDFTGSRDELRIQRLLLSVRHDELARFKFTLDYDGDYKDLEEYVFHDVDNKVLRAGILAHLAAAAAGRGPVGTKVLTDVDDTLYANLVDRRYPKETFYPGVLELYQAIQREPFAIEGVPVTTLSARPNPVGGTLEEGSIGSLVERSGGRLRPSALSGEVASSALGTFETLTREKRAEAEADFDRWLARLPGSPSRSGLPSGPDGFERKIGQVKFDNFRRFARVYPEYRYVFFGDSGQADALTAELMVGDQAAEFGGRVVATFIHDLRESGNDAGGSPSFRQVLARQPSGAAPIFLFRNHIDAAVQAHRHSTELVPAAALAAVTRAALIQFGQIDFTGLDDSRRRLGAQFAADARAALALLQSNPDPGEDVDGIERLLAGL